MTARSAVVVSALPRHIDYPIFCRDESIPIFGTDERGQVFYPNTLNVCNAGLISNANGFVVEKESVRDGVGAALPNGVRYRTGPRKR